MYTELYGFTDLPFQLTPDARFFFGSAGHSKAMAHLSYGLHQGEGFIVITGDVGTGKTTLVDLLLSKLDSAANVVARIVTTQLEADDMLRSVAAAFGVYEEKLEKAGMLRRVETLLIANHRAQKRSLLIVDEAQNLSLGALEELRMLSNITIDGQTPLQSFLLGQPQFRRTLASPALEQLKQRVTVSYHLGPLTEIETKAYILHRLKLVGWKEDPIFEDEVFRIVHRHAEGVPRRINTLFSRILLFGFLETRHAIDGESAERVAEELADEMAFAPKRAAQSPEVTDGADGSALARRVQSLERKVERHEQTIKLALKIAGNYAQRLRQRR